MRALRVVGLDEDGETVICEDPDNGERFSVPADERLRAAARGDLTRLGQVQIELEAQMRPREIQSRIRGGASVEQVAAASGLPEQRVERYAYPVLLERAQIAEKAQRAHPIREDGPDVQTLGEIVAHTFGMRGHDYAETVWDSWRGEDGKWVVQLRWQAGKSENTAYWVFHPGAQGGTATALDEHAADLLDPSPNRPLRTVRPVTELAREALELDQDDTGSSAASGEPGTGWTPSPIGEQAPSRPEHEVPLPSSPPSGAPAGAEAPAPAARPSPQIPPVASNPHIEAPPGATAPDGTSPDEVAAEARNRRVDPCEHTEAATTEVPDVGEVLGDASAQESATHEQAPRRGRKQHPIVPSWEDVLLGVRSHR
ncbi:DUF3071 family protein [Halopolyspora algeriensis]|uniref:DUF3071 family protein n=1 Tax=Halopolyspora algeriensis TaxID=1500506 RepID=A0A368VQ56_9ACTN|nr:septation protein SepH [Halopolyspora algeriensis]RCW43628.1 DUF3071 family protein [Halopolyspora algeriensis]TQM47589.1 DUF3071 family protein [Halopolyspora algeriensis]